MPDGDAKCSAFWLTVFPLRSRRSTASCLNSGVKMRRGLPMRHLHFAMMLGRCTQFKRKFTLCCMNDGPIINVSLWSQNACVMADHGNSFEPQPFQHLL